MLIKSLHVRNFRSLLGETIDFDSLTALVGSNGSGKSTLLGALELFYTGSPRVTSDDFYAEDAETEIEIALTFADLSGNENERFSAYIDHGQLTVARIFSADPKSSGKYFGSKLQHPDLVAVRKAGGAKDQKASYEALRGKTGFTDLPKWTNQEASLAALAEWEGAHPESCVRLRDDGQFFGFTEVAQGKLGRSTRFIVVPAVRDAATDAADTKASPVGEIMELVVRSVLARREELQRFKEELDKRFHELYAPENLAELQALGSQLTSTLRTYAPETSVALAWLPTGEIQVPMPKALVKLVEDGYGAPVAKTGHGLQRAFILTMLQHLALLRGAATAEESQGPTEVESAPVATGSGAPDLVLAIEEPELYQHPNRQRHLARVLAALSDGSLPGVSRRMQVVYCTHSPLFVGLDRFDQIRLFRKTTAEPGKPKQTKVVASSLDAVAETLWVANGSVGPKFTAISLRPRLAPLMTPGMNEGFFASVVVLVEGESDRAALLGTAMATGRDLERDGVSVISCQGKDSLDRPFAVFQSFGIPTYVVWDNDSTGADPSNAISSNRLLLRLLGEPEQDWPSGVSTSHAVLQGKLEQVLEGEIGSQLFGGLLVQAQREMGFEKRVDALKNVGIISSVVSLAAEEGARSTTIEAIAAKALQLKTGTSSA